jgi:hypothetical protein
MKNRDVETIARANASMAIDQNESPDSYRQNAQDTVIANGGTVGQWHDVQAMFDRFYDEAKKR